MPSCPLVAETANGVFASQPDAGNNRSYSKSIVRPSLGRLCLAASEGIDIPPACLAGGVVSDVRLQTGGVHNFAGCFRAEKRPVVLSNKQLDNRT